MAKILIVEDEGDIVEALTDVLRADGHDVESARDGLEAVAAVRRHRPDVILLDLMMPKFSGAELLAHWHSRSESGIPVVVMSGASRAAIMRASTPHPQVSATLAKPMGIEQVLEAVAIALRVKPVD